jgi:hypothetical protein
LNSPPPKADAVNSSSVEINQAQDVAATAVPSFISIDEPSEAKDRMGSDSIMVSLSPKEVEIVNMLRCRPGNDYPDTLNHWKESLVKMTEELTFQRSLSSPPTVKAETDTKDDKPATTPGGNDGASVASFDTEEFENFNFFATEDFFEEV